MTRPRLRFRRHRTRLRYQRQDRRVRFWRQTQASRTQPVGGAVATFDQRLADAVRQLGIVVVDW